MSQPPIIISTWSFGQRGNRAAWQALNNGGSSLDAVETASTTVEADEEVDSVGRGGLPDASGIVSLDASIMQSPARRGSVCYVRNYLAVTTLARLVMDQTPHVMLAGEGAEQLAAKNQLSTRELLTDAAKDKYETWKLKKQPVDQSADFGLAVNDDLRPIDTGSPALFQKRDSNNNDRSNDEARWSNHDTIGTLALDSQGTLAGACSTSGSPFKHPGRVGDSPIIGHGLYVEPTIGAATATGSGELVMGICGSFLVVELMRIGHAPIDAIRSALERIENTYDLSPRDQVAFIALTRSGDWAAGALRKGFKVAVHTRDADIITDPQFVLQDD